MEHVSHIHTKNICLYIYLDVNVLLSLRETLKNNYWLCVALIDNCKPTLPAPIYQLGIIHESHFINEIMQS